MLNRLSHFELAPHNLKRLLCIIFIFNLTWKYFQGGLIHQYSNPPAHYVGIDPAYWILHASGLYHWLAIDTNALLVEVLLLILLVLGALLPKSWIIVSIPILLVPYGLANNAAMGFPSHSTYPLLFSSIPLLFAASRSFLLLCASVRYYTAFIFVSAAGYKIFGGGLSNIKDMADLILYQHSQYFMFSRQSAHQSFLMWLSSQPRLAGALFLSVVLLQSSFLLAFFTRAFDHFLALFALLFVAGIWLVMRLDFTELIALVPFFFVGNTTISNQAGESKKFFKEEI